MHLLPALVGFFVCANAFSMQEGSSTKFDFSYAVLCQDWDGALAIGKEIPDLDPNMKVCTRGPFAGHSILSFSALHHVWNFFLEMLERTNDVDNDAMPVSKGSEGRDMISYIVEDRRWDIVKLVVQKSPNKKFGKTISRIRSLQELAAYQGAWELVKFLLERDPECDLEVLSPHYGERSESGILFVAADAKKWDIVLHIAKTRPEIKVDYHPTMEAGRASALANAVKANQWDVVEKLLINHPQAELSERFEVGIYGVVGSQIYMLAPFELFFSTFNEQAKIFSAANFFRSYVSSIEGRTKPMILLYWRYHKDEMRGDKLKKLVLPNFNFSFYDTVTELQKTFEMISREIFGGDTELAKRIYLLPPDVKATLALELVKVLDPELGKLDQNFQRECIDCYVTSGPLSSVSESDHFLRASKIIASSVTQTLMPNETRGNNLLMPVTRASIDAIHTIIEEEILRANKSGLWQGTLTLLKRQAIIDALIKIPSFEYEREKIYEAIVQALTPVEENN